MTDDGASVSTGQGHEVREVAVVAAGVIGISWTGLFLTHGLQVRVYDPSPDVEAAVLRGLAEITPALAALGLPTDDLTAGLVFAPDVASAVEGADVVQENGPENLDLKRELFAEIERSTSPRTLVLSSTSALMPTLLARDLQRPVRLLVGHPFNPPHLVPLVEVVPGERTEPAAVEEALAFYRGLGKAPMVVHKERRGFVANRLQSALFREAVSLVEQGVVTVEELDEIVRNSIGLRWAAAGPFRTFHLGGGPGGLAHFIAHLGPGQQAGWKQLGDPSYDERTVAILLSQVEESFGATPYAELLQERDRGPDRDHGRAGAGRAGTGQLGLTTPASASAATSSGLRPSPASTSRVCCPTDGAGPRGPMSAPWMRNGLATVRKVP